MQVERRRKGSVVTGMMRTMTTRYGRVRGGLTATRLTLSSAKAPLDK